MDQDILIKVYTEIIGRLESFINSTQSSITSSIHPIVVTGATLYFVMYGIAILRGTSEEPFIEIAMRGLKVAIIAALATQTAVYDEWVVQPLMHGIPDGLAQAVAGENGGAEVFSTMFAKAYAVAASIYAKSTGTVQPVVAGSLAIVVIAAAALYCGVGVALLAITQLALALVVAIGPIFIGLFLFEPTRRFGMGWLSQAINFQVLYLCVLGLGALITNSILKVIPEYETYDYAQMFDLGVSALVMTLLGAGTVFFLPAIASGIIGGAPLPFGNYARTFRGAGRGAATAGRAARGAVSRVSRYMRAA